MPGMVELLLILAIVLVIFGAGKIPGIGDALGRGIRNFKKASSGEDDKLDGKNPPAQNSAKELAPGAETKTLSAGSSDDEFEEVVVRRRVKKDA